jgi:RNase P/RNase MRP subunit POP5
VNVLSDLQQAIIKLSFAPHSLILTVKCIDKRFISFETIHISIKGIMFNNKLGDCNTAINRRGVTKDSFSTNRRIVAVDITQEIWSAVVALTYPKHLLWQIMSSYFKRKPT